MHKPEKSTAQLEQDLIAAHQRLATCEALAASRQDAQEAAEALAAVLALENARLSQDLEARIDRFRILTRLNQLVSSLLDMDEVLSEIAQAASTLMQTPFVSFWVADEAARTLDLRAYSDARLRAGMPRIRMTFDEGIAGWVATHRQAINLPDVFVHSWLVSHDWWRENGLSSMLAIPVLFEDTLFAVLTFIGRKPFHFSSDDQQLLESFVAQAAVALRNAQAYQESERRQKRLATLVEVAQRLTRGLELPTVLQAIAEEAAAIFEAEAGFRLLEGEDLVRAATTPGARRMMLRQRLKLGESLSGQVAASGEAFITVNSLAEARFIPEHKAAVQAQGFGAWMCVPVRQASRVLGTLSIARKQGYCFDQDDVRVALSLADQAAIAIENARLFGEVRKQTAKLQEANNALQDEIAERKRTEEELRTSEERFAMAFQATPEALAITDLHGRYIDVNESYLRLTGYRRDEVIGRTSVELRRWTNLEERARVVQVLHEQGSVREVEISLRSKSGEARASRLSIEAIELHGEPCLLCITRDVTEARQLEAQLRQAQKMEAIDTLAGGIAHDFNNILSAMMGYTELASYDLPEDSMIRVYLHEVLTAGKRARDLVQQILAFSRHQESERQPLQLHLLLKEVLMLARASLPSTIEIQQHIDASHSVVLADPIQMHRVLLNLCGNAEHAMRATGGVLEVRLDAIEVDTDLATTHQELQPGPHVRLSVRDTGCGMPPEVVERIFEPFFTTKGIGEGTGMGLAMVHGIVTGHGGAITVASTLGQGTTFVIYLPRIHVGVADTSGTEEPIPTGGECILFVDDEESIAQVGRALLNHLGHEVVACTDSLQALETFRAAPRRFDLVITDQTMPGMTGEHLAREIRRIRPDLPIILCSGFSHTMTEDKAQALGIDAFLMKPMELRELGLAVRRVLDAHSNQDADRGERILLIDDDAQMRHMLRQGLERHGYAVVEAQSNTAGVQRYREEPVDLIITDILAPEKEGLETIAEIRQRCATAKIIAISSGDLASTIHGAEIAETFGVQHTLRKPFALQDLLAIVREVLQSANNQP